MSHDQGSWTLDELFERLFVFGLHCWCFDLPFLVCLCLSQVTLCYAMLVVSCFILTFISCPPVTFLSLYVFSCFPVIGCTCCECVSPVSFIKYEALCIWVEVTHSTPLQNHWSSITLWAVVFPNELYVMNCIISHYCYHYYYACIGSLMTWQQYSRSNHN